MTGPGGEPTKRDERRDSRRGQYQQRQRERQLERQRQIRRQQITRTAITSAASSSGPRTLRTDPCRNRQRRRQACADQAQLNTPPPRWARPAKKWRAWPSLGSNSISTPIWPITSTGSRSTSRQIPACFDLHLSRSRTRAVSEHPTHRGAEPGHISPWRLLRHLGAASQRHPGGSERRRRDPTLTFETIDANGNVTKWPANQDPWDIPLTAHETVFILYNSPDIKPTAYTQWGGL